MWFNICQHLYWTSKEQERIPVGCVPSAAVAVWGCLPRGASAQRRGGVVSSRGGVYPSRHPFLGRILDTCLWKHYLSAMQTVIYSSICLCSVCDDCLSDMHKDVYTHSMRFNICQTSTEHLSDVALSISTQYDSCLSGYQVAVRCSLPMQHILRQMRMFSMVTHLPDMHNQHRITSAKRYVYVIFPTNVIRRQTHSQQV